MICTAIPYVNGDFHIGNSLTDIAGDVHARYLRLRGEDIFLQVGTDENGLKIKEAAESAGADPMAFVAEKANRFRTVFDGLNISYDTFVRTTEPRHVKASQELFRRLRDAGHVYIGKYEGWYDVSTETYFREEDIVDGKSPDGNPVRWVSEDNYFFRLSAFTDAISAHIEQNPGFIRPESRKNEVISFLKQGLRDISITRRNPGWGIPVPDDEGKVIYVWFDALICYLTGAGWPDAGWEEKWPPKTQWVGKDILTRFHATLWPAMLMGIGVPLFDTVAAHGWILMGGEKISKSKGNVVRPLELIAEVTEKAGIPTAIATDVLRHFVTATAPLDSDSTFTYDDFYLRYNVDLANDLGNALNRSLAMAHKFVGGVVPDAAPEAEATEAIERAVRGYETAMDNYEISRAVEAAWGLVRFLNKYIDTRAPWALAKSGDAALGPVLRSMLLCLRATEGLIRPSIPAVADAISEQLSLPGQTDWKQIGNVETLPAGTALQQPRPIFPRLDLTKKPEEGEKKKETKQMENKPAPAAKPDKPAATPVAVTEIGIEDFAKVQLRIGRVLEAEPVEGSDKLMKLQVVIDQDRRQIVAGIRKNYGPEDLIGRQVVVCTNLKPAKLRGVESQGMLLAATDQDGGAILLQPDREAPEGTNVK